jgi:hypothetical protein
MDCVHQARRQRADETAREGRKVKMEVASSAMVKRALLPSASFPAFGHDEHGESPMGVAFQRPHMHIAQVHF